MTSHRRRSALLLGLGALAGVVGFALTAAVFVKTSETPFCMSCHEMQFLAEQGWMRSVHYQNPHGVVAECADCHIPPDLVGMVWAKTRDGINDVVVHTFGESDPQRMDWDALGASARSHIHDASCRRCHDNLAPRGAPIAQIVAHTAAQREGGKRCVDCHLQRFHDGFREALATELAPGGER